MFNKLKMLAFRYAGATPLAIAAICLICVLFTLILLHTVRDLERL